MFGEVNKCSRFTLWSWLSATTALSFWIRAEQLKANKFGSPTNEKILIITGESYPTAFAVDNAIKLIPQIWKCYLIKGHVNRFWAYLKLVNLVISTCIILHFNENKITLRLITHCTKAYRSALKFKNDLYANSRRKIIKKNKNVQFTHTKLR